MQYCLHQGGHHAEPHHIRLMEDCVQICQTNADFMLRGSDLHKFVCTACAEICDRCGRDCGNMNDDDRMQACAKSCERCAKLCRLMSASGH
jgi:hypothetical protein